MNTSIAAETKREQLRQRLSAPGLIVAPGVFDMISARIADRTGFDVLYMTGYGAVASYLGLPDAGLASYTDMANRAIAGELYEFEAFSRLMGFEAVWEFDRAHAEIQPADKP